MTTVVASGVPRSAPGRVLNDLLGCAAGGALSREYAYQLMRPEGSEFSHVVAAAGALRDRGKGRTVTYSRKVFIPLTNLCRDKCGYCTFAKPPLHPDARTLDPDDVLSIAEAGRAQGCKEALFSLGEKPEERYASVRRQLRRLGHTTMTSYLAAMCRLVYEETALIPHVNCGVLTRDELIELRECSASMGLMLESSSDRLLERGQAHFGCVGKAPETRLETMATAGQLRIAFTTGILIGIGETLEERVDSLFAIRDLQRAHGHVQEVIIQNFRVKPDIRMRRWPEPSLDDMVRTIAVARLILGPQMNVQAPPNLVKDSGDSGHGTDVVPEHRPPCDLSPLTCYLQAGINDWGGISPVTLDHINPERAWPTIASLREATAAAGFDLRERLCLYPEYVQRDEFVPEVFRTAVHSKTDASGLVRREDTQW